MNLTELLLMIFTAPAAGIVVITVQYRRDQARKRGRG